MTTIINIGARYDIRHPEKKGGVVVLFEQWIDFCKNQEKEGVISSIVIDSNKGNYNTKSILGRQFSYIVSYLLIIKQVKYILKRAVSKNNEVVVMLHGTLFDYIWLAPIVENIAHKFGVKVILRKFAGNFADIYEASNSLKQKYIKKVLASADMLFWESKRLVEWGKQFNKETYWFTNVREDSLVRREKVPYRKRFVFLSRVEKQKGIIDLINCFQTLGMEYSLDIYGPIWDNLSENLLNTFNTKYKGIIQPHEVSSKLAEYDVLVLPTKWETEGYPGIIIEAFNVGIPVIASIIGGIPEMVINGYNGFLTEAGNIEDLKKAIIGIKEENYSRLSDNALKSFDTYDADKVNNQILSKILNLK